MNKSLSRRRVLQLSAGVMTSAMLPRISLGADPINVGSLTPNTGGGGPFGPKIAAAHKRIVDQVNAAGGILGREVALTQENSETNPETAIRAADKLINLNQVRAILGTWSSSVTLGIMPKCQDADVIQMCTSSSSDIPLRDEKNLVFNFQALSPVWGRAIGNLAKAQGFKSYALMALNNDFTKSMLTGFNEIVGEDSNLIKPFFYNGGQSSYRSEVEKLIAQNPDAVFIPSYVTDFTVVYKDIFRSGYEGQVITTSIATGDKFKAAVGDAAEGIMHGIPVPPIESQAYQEYLAEAELEDTGNVQHPFGTAGRDQMSTLLMAMEKAGSDEGPAIAKAMHEITTGDGVPVYNVTDGLTAIKAGEDINYSGASSAVEFDDEGMVLGRDFQLSKIEGGSDVVLDRLEY